MFMDICKGTILGIALLGIIVLVGWVSILVLDFVIHMMTPNQATVFVSMPVILYVSYLFGSAIRQLHYEKRT